jgi:hypothetical protein
MTSGERASRKLLDQIALDVHRYAVDPACARLVEERQWGETVDHLLERRRGERVRGLIQLVDRRVAEQSVGEAGRV